MVKEAEEFAAEDEVNRKKIEALNGLQEYAWSMKSQVSDGEDVGGKLSEEDNKTACR